MKIDLEQINNTQYAQLVSLGLLFTDEIQNPSVDLALQFIEKKFEIYVETPLDKTSVPKFCLEITRFDQINGFTQLNVSLSDWGLYTKKVSAKERGLQLSLEYILKVLKK